MNKLKSMKYKTDDSLHNNDHSIMDKLSKRYSTVRFLRSKSSTRKDAAANNSLSGSYDMNGRNSDDHKLEIGAPILISKTAIDTDTIDTRKYRHCNNVHSQSEQSLNQSDIYQNANSSLDIQQQSLCSTDLKNSQQSIESNDENGYEYDKIMHRLSDPTEVNNNNGSGNFVGNRSKSATNLHKTELSVYIQRSPSMDIANRFGKTITSKHLCNRSHDKRTLSKQSIETDNSSFNNSRNSIAVNGSMFDEDTLDFDMKSASYQSLNARNIFLSIEELNEITRQINESDDFRIETDNNEDLEYQIHRDNLKPCERRVTLLRNKNQSRFLNITPNRDKFTNAWSGFKSWIGEEKGKLKDVVNKHAAMQRVGASMKTGTTTDQCDGVTIVNGTALQITQNATETHDERLQSNSMNDRNESLNNINEQCNNQHRRVIGSENNDNNQTTTMSSMKGKSSHELEVINERNSSFFFLISNFSF